jgi:hypothetical protein
LVCKNKISSEEHQLAMQQIGGSLCHQHREELLGAMSYTTPESRLLYFALLHRNIPAIIEKFDGYNHIDIAVPEAKVNVEVDGLHHNHSSQQALADLKRTLHSFRRGYYTLRIPNSLVREKLEETADHVARFVVESMKRIDKNPSGRRRLSMEL